MRTLMFNDIKVVLYDSKKQFIKHFYDLPRGAVLDESQVPESTGFANLQDKEIYIFKNKGCSFEDLLETVSHELGHLIEGGFKKNPPDKQRYSKRHEEKAEHYENFVINSYKLTKLLFELQKK